MTDRADNAYEQWRRERPDIDPFPMQVLGRLFEATQRLERDHLNPLFARFGLRPGEFDVLATLRRSGAPYALTPTQLYEALMMSSGGMTNRIDRLEQAQWVARQSNPQDRRGTLVTLTEQGRELMDTLVALHTDNERQALASLNEDEQQQLNLLLKKLLAGLPQP
ncbi:MULTISPECIES: MarR family winged helix-turn-helix transcriptional regulator [Dickeya]|uniref:MarR family winged helix-turn-helix transcriptional regulator n=1 Tax=Dickeya TaxID=204037 RepID=UPI0005774B24|nr:MULTISPECIES: MarR family transcriptional regulator [Dickeya]AYH47822.1 MarR family transcriptional regulator [Dickeya fangzhongdai]MBO8133212.1 MarR family transcriptional regulator [Dickeya fangzhongdai]UGA52699.1 MarR family transcriptional regulator [Dickeya fangzhongdai]UWH09029.1 MarR family transcriptional regulator [Dickeya fangzhongdai]WKV51412.1 MarR family transcriptional regulator [Dickeya fangzhongdai]